MYDDQYITSITASFRKVDIFPTIASSTIGFIIENLVAYYLDATITEPIMPKEYRQNGSTFYEEWGHTVI